MTDQSPKTTSELTYASYLDLDVLLSAQNPRSDEHDEMLFVIIHQTKELWLKQILHEVALAQALVAGRRSGAGLQEPGPGQPHPGGDDQSWDILATMTPADYLRFRGVLGTSSGFQSDQFRRFEYMLGLKDDRFLQLPRRTGPRPMPPCRPPSPHPACMTTPWPSWRRPACRCRPRCSTVTSASPYEPSDGVEAAWLEVYRDTTRWWPFYQLAEKLVDLDDALLTWRHKHVVTVERIIGRRRGTGGTEGVAYLTETLQRRCFPELWSLRTKL